MDFVKDYWYQSAFLAKKLCTVISRKSKYQPVEEFRSPSAKVFKIPSILALLPFIFQLPPTKNFLSIAISHTDVYLSFDVQRSMILEKIVVGKQSTECNIQCTVYGIPTSSRLRFADSMSSWAQSISCHRLTILQDCLYVIKAVTCATVHFYVVAFFCFKKEVKIIPNLLVTYLTILQDWVKLPSRLSAPYRKCSNKRPIKELEKGWRRARRDFIISNFRLKMTFIFREVTTENTSHGVRRLVEA